LKQCAAYADDTLITARTNQAMIDTFNKLKMESIKYGFVINEKITKYMKCTRRKESKIEDLEIGNLKIGKIRSFKYIGAIVNEENTIEEEIKKRTAV
jgi:hypothetical protein